MSSFHFVKLTPWTKVTLDKRLLGQLCHWTKVPWTTVTLDNRPLDNCCNTVKPSRVIKIKDQYRYIEHIKPEQVYYYLIEPKIKMSVGLQQWLDEMGLTESDIRTGFSFARECSKSTFDHVFQYKIMTQILPTYKYLCQYRVLESNL